ncbi:hypothetical protein ACIPZC_18485 [Pseudomonas sp. NPDC089743]|uniref:hypothetical protein n=1 Tax=Pseudomonas sp. NPDC089743 TaxID=3364471 RepID=UPI0037FA9B27
MEVLSRGEIVGKIKERTIWKSSEVCHVVGSGWSLNRSKIEIEKNDFVIGFNYAGIYDLNYDAYFVEFGGIGVSKVAISHKNIVDNVVSKSTDIILFKNLWESKNDKYFIEKKWGQSVKYAKDYVVPCIREASLKGILENCLNESGMYLPQYTSTALTCVFLMYFSGYKSIVLHGIDFGGQYFYEASDFDGDRDYCPQLEVSDKFYKATTINTVHPTATSSVGMKTAIPILASLLAHRGVTLYAAHESSPLSSFLPVYKK